MSQLAWACSATCSTTLIAFENCWRTSLAKKRKIQKLTAEERAERERHFQMSRERMAYHEAKAREEEERKRKAAGSA